MLELPKKHIFWFKANRQNPEVDFLVSLTLVELGNEPLHLPSELGVGQCLKLSCGAAPTPALSSFRAASNSSTVALITLGLASAAMTKQDCWQCWRLISEFQLRQESIENWIVASALQKNRSKNHAISRNRPLSCLVLLKFFVQIKRSKLEHPHVFALLQLAISSFLWSSLGSGQLFSMVSEAYGEPQTAGVCVSYIVIKWWSTEMQYQVIIDRYAMRRTCRSLILASKHLSS